MISRYDQVHGRNSFQRDKAKVPDDRAERSRRATVDVGAVIDFAPSFGTLVLTRAYADLSADVNASYRSQLVARAVDLVQLFPAAAYGKNGADIRLAVDAVEDMFRLPDLTHVVIVAGDSDYIAVAQRCKRLGRYVVGIGVAGSSSGRWRRPATSSSCMTRFGVCRPKRPKTGGSHARPGPVDPAATTPSRPPHRPRPPAC